MSLMASVIPSASVNVLGEELKLHPGGAAEGAHTRFTPMPKPNGVLPKWSCVWLAPRTGPRDEAVSYLHAVRPRAHSAAVSMQSASDRKVAMFSNRRRTSTF